MCVVLCGRCLLCGYGMVYKVLGALPVSPFGCCFPCHSEALDSLSGLLSPAAGLLGQPVPWVGMKLWWEQEKGSGGPELPKSGVRRGRTSSTEGFPV